MAALSEVTNAKVEIMAHYDKDASEFDFERSAAGYRIRHRLVKKLIIKQDRRSGFAFDIGCGTGEYTISLAEAGFDSVDGDISKGTLAIAQSKVRDHDRAGRIHLLRLESTRLPKWKTLANKVLRMTEPIDSHLRNLPILRFLSEHYIIEARKK
jgi:ubiquinone/menaquinone biosynthesis C-methylase UbiE